MKARMRNIAIKKCVYTNSSYLYVVRRRAAESATVLNSHLKKNKVEKNQEVKGEKWMAARKEERRGEESKKIFILKWKNKRRR